MDVTPNAVNLWTAKAFITNKLDEGMLDSKAFDSISARIPIAKLEWIKSGGNFDLRIHGVITLSRSADNPDAYRITFGIVDEIDGIVYSSNSGTHSRENISAYFHKLMDTDQTKHDLDLLKRIAKSVPRLKKYF